MKFYALAVCFATLICGAITLGFFTFNVVKIASPKLTMNPSMLRMYDSVESYRKSQATPTAAIAMASSLALKSSGELVMPSGVQQTDENQLSDEQIEEILLERRASMLESHIFRAKQGLLLQAIVLAICCALYHFHWRLARKLEAESDT